MASQTLRERADARGVLIGATVSARPLSSEEPYRETLAREFNALTTENALKWGPVHPERDRYDFSRADAIIDFAEEHGMSARGHTLVWHNQNPRWLTEGSFSRDELLEIMREHIHAVAGRYRGRIAFWDVVNEAIAEDGALRRTIWLDGIGAEYLDHAFRFAHEAAPDAKLFYNDFGAEGLGAKSDGVYEVVKALRERGAPIHGVGLQMHFGLDRHPPLDEIGANIRRLAELGLDVHVTELDVALQDASGSRDQRVSRQADLYGQILETCLRTESCQAFSLWGFTDGHSWIPGHTGNPDWPLIFDDHYQPKPAYDALCRVLSEWHERRDTQ